MKEMTLQEMQCVEFDILKYIMGIGEKYQIPIFLAYGSLLGAVRHNGFIPWDDDIDVMLTRANYYRLITAIESEESQYKFVSMETSENYSMPLAKIYDPRTLVIEEYGSIITGEFGVYVDIFVLDNIPNEKKASEKFFRSANRKRFYYALSTRKFLFVKNRPIWSVCRNILITPFRIIGYKFFLRYYDRYCKKYSKSTTDYVGIVLFGEGSDQKERCHIGKLTGNTKIRFETIDCCVPDNYANYLENLYGDYMELPPIEERITKHIHKVFWK